MSSSRAKGNCFLWIKSLYCVHPAADGDQVTLSISPFKRPRSADWTGAPSPGSVTNLRSQMLRRFPTKASKPMNLYLHLSSSAAGPLGYATIVPIGIGIGKVIKPGPPIDILPLKNGRDEECAHFMGVKADFFVTWNVLTGEPVFDEYVDEDKIDELLSKTHLLWGKQVVLNLRTREVHLPDCRWVPYIKPDYRVPAKGGSILYDTAPVIQRFGDWDGCAYCLPELHFK
jgi:hypothetical protein